MNNRLLKLYALYGKDEFSASLLGSLYMKQYENDGLIDVEWRLKTSSDDVEYYEIMCRITDKYIESI